MPNVRHAGSDAEIAACFPVMVQLRPHLAADAFVPRVRRMQATGYHLSYATDDGGAVRAVAGWRVLDQLVRGPVLYVDDLVTDAVARSRGFGEALLDALYAEACARGCAALELDSGVQRAAAHRFYFRERMTIVGYHFVRACGERHAPP